MHFRWYFRKNLDHSVTGHVQNVFVKTVITSRDKFLNGQNGNIWGIHGENQGENSKNVIGQFHANFKIVETKRIWCHILKLDVWF